MFQHYILLRLDLVGEEPPPPRPPETSPARPLWDWSWSWGSASSALLFNSSRDISIKTFLSIGILRVRTMPERFNYFATKSGRLVIRNRCLSRKLEDSKMQKPSALSVTRKKQNSPLQNEIFQVLSTVYEYIIIFWKLS